MDSDWFGSKSYYFSTRFITDQCMDKWKYILSVSPCVVFLVFCSLMKIFMLVAEGMEPKSHNYPLPPYGAEISTPRSEGPSLSDTIYGQLKNLTIEESSSESSSSSESGNVPAAADSIIASPGEAVSIPSRGVVRVYSRALNITLPKGSEVAFSDENWIAVVAGADPIN